MNASIPPIANVASILEAAAQLFRVTVLKCLPFAMIALISRLAPIVFWQPKEVRLFDPRLLADWHYWAAAGFADVMLIFLGGAMMLRQRKVASGESVHALSELAAAGRRLPWWIGTYLLVLASLAVGVAALVLPAVYLMICYLILPPVLLFEQRTPISALRRCLQLVTRHWWKVLATLVFAVLICAVTFATVAIVLNIIVYAIIGQGALAQAIMAAGVIAIGGMALVFLSAVSLTVYSAASNSS